MERFGNRSRANSALCTSYKPTMEGEVARALLDRRDTDADQGDDVAVTELQDGVAPGGAGDVGQDLSEPVPEPGRLRVS